MTRNINSDAENCQAEVGVPRGGIHSRGASYSGVTCPGWGGGGGQFTPGGSSPYTPVSMADVRHKTVSAATVWVRRGQVHYPDQRLVHDGPRM